MISPSINSMVARSFAVVLVASLLVSSAAALFTSDKDPSLDASILSLKFKNSTASIINNHPSDHDSLIPLQATDIVGFLCAAFGLIIAAGGGIGGGGILVPIYILILGFLPKHAIPLSNVTVFGGAIANTLRNSRKRHPKADRPLIDWDMIVVMEPPTLAGALIGANLNKILPETVIAVMLVLLLSFTAYNTLKKARKMYQKETEEIKRQNVGTRTVAVDTTTMIPDSKFGKSVMNEYLLINQDNHDSMSDDEDVGDTESNDVTVTGLSLHDLDSSRHPPSYRHGLSSLSSIQLDDEYDDIDEENSSAEDYEENSSAEDLPAFGNPITIEDIVEEEKHPKRRNIFLIVAMFFVVLLINILKGGGGFQSPIGIQCGSAAFWAAQAVLLVWILLISWLGRRLLLKEAARKAEAGYIYLDEDLKWDRKSTIIYPLISTLAGFCAGMFGIGGGIIKGPLMLAMGVHPAVASATSACMILFTSFTATTTFSVYGLMVPDYAIVGGVLGFVATLVGQTVMSRILAKSKRNSYIAFSIGVVVLLSAILMALESVLHLITDDEDEEFSGICDSHLHGHGA
eukprot:CAMPEP_0183718894 /NCGR_PEP_ID=MMETSP0737-20130205/12026_1 /TAXON_ID=385413 /ORGANISM="Thalassiosira miniscula, Strain CCMP1093" /LENGTH=571 /DNA_ID=CAMNT_0025948537 /DNA_START=8 /DNA_END=1723 /DNA_ORIENTATION=-